jgi:hypothetical protein
MAHSNENPKDTEELETLRYQFVDRVKAHFGRARKVQRWMFALTAGLAIGGAIGYAHDSKPAEALILATIPLGAVSAIRQHSDKKQATHLVGEFLALEGYAKGEVGASDLDPADAPQVKPPAKEWYDHVASPEVNYMLTYPLTGFGVYGAASEMLVNHVDTHANMNAVAASSVMAVTGVALYGLTEHSLNVHEQNLLNQLGAPGPL